MSVGLGNTAANANNEEAIKRGNNLLRALANNSQSRDTVIQNIGVFKMNAAGKSTKEDIHGLLTVFVNAIIPASNKPDQEAKRVESRERVLAYLMSKVEKPLKNEQSQIDILFGRIISKDFVRIKKSREEKLAEKAAEAQRKELEAKAKLEAAAKEKKDTPETKEDKKEEPKDLTKEAPKDTTAEKKDEKDKAGNKDAKHDVKKEDTKPGETKPATTPSPIDLEELAKAREANKLKRQQAQLAKDKPTDKPVTPPETIEAKPAANEIKEAAKLLKAKLDAKEKEEKAKNDAKERKEKEELANEKKKNLEKEIEELKAKQKELLEEKRDIYFGKKDEQVAKDNEKKYSDFIEKLENCDLKKQEDVDLRNKLIVILKILKERKIEDLNEDSFNIFEDNKDAILNIQKEKALDENKKQFEAIHNHELIEVPFYFSDLKIKNEYKENAKKIRENDKALEEKEEELKPVLEEIQEMKEEDEIAAKLGIPPYDPTVKLVFEEARKDKADQKNPQNAALDNVNKPAGAKPGDKKDVNNQPPAQEELSEDDLLAIAIAESLQDEQKGAEKPKDPAKKAPVPAKNPVPNKKVEPPKVQPPKKADPKKVDQPKKADEPKKEEPKKVDNADNGDNKPKGILSRFANLFKRCFNWFFGFFKKDKEKV